MLVAKLESLVEVIVLQGCLDVQSELGQRTLTESSAESQDTLDRECDDSQQQCVNQRYDNTTLVDCSPNVTILYCASRVVINEVSRHAEEELEEAYCNDEAYNDDPECVSNTSEALRLFLRGYFLLLCSCHNFLKFKILVINKFKL